MIELIVVISIIAIVAGLVVVGIASSLGGARDRVTETRLESLTTMLTNYRRNTAGSVGAGATATARSLPRSLDANAGPLDFADYVPPATVGDVGDLTDDENPNYYIYFYTGPVMQRLLQVPTNRSAFDALPAADKVTREGVDPNDPTETVTYSFLLDGHGELILYVPSSGMTGLTFADGALPGWDPGNTDHRLLSRDGNPFFASAGPDGSFKQAGDNVYSTDVVPTDISDGSVIE